MIDSNLNIKIVDFGYAKFDPTYGEEDSIYCDTIVGTKLYMAPEIKEQKIYNGKKSDIFALGVILYSIV